MSTAETMWAESLVKSQGNSGSWRDDILAIALVCMIFGLQIIAVMQTTGGTDAYRMVATEGMQQN
ncbi:MAG TPA: hypothetical protein VMB73_07635 [Acetobacteraceae bacterium]|jgi:hypothetical protein|nr:hypothetical protein [Acetobacteraceae bacterium]